MLPISSQKLFSFPRYPNLYYDFLVMHKKQLDQKEKVNLKIYDFKTQLTNNCNKQIAQHPMKQKQPDNETWSINRLQQEKYLFRKIMLKMRWGNQFQSSFYFFEFTKYEVKAIGQQLSFNVFQYPSTQDTIKIKCTKPQTIDPEVCSILIFQKRV